MIQIYVNFLNVLSWEAKMTRYAQCIAYAQSDAYNDPESDRKICPEERRR